MYNGHEQQLPYDEFGDFDTEQYQPTNEEFDDPDKLEDPWLDGLLAKINKETNPSQPEGDTLFTPTGFILSKITLHQFLALAATEEYIKKVDISDNVTFSLEELNQAPIPESIFETVINAWIHYLIEIPLIYDTFEDDFPEIELETIHQYRRTVYKELKIDNKHRDNKIRGNSFDAIHFSVNTFRNQLFHLNLHQNSQDAILSKINNFKAISEKYLEDFGSYNKIPTLIKVTIAVDQTIALNELITTIIEVYRGDSAFS